MRVCDVSKQPGVTSRVIVIEVPLNFEGTVALDHADAGRDPVPVEPMHDLEVTDEVLTAFAEKDWPKLQELTPRDDRRKSTSRRSEGARKAAKTRAQRKREETDVAVAAAAARADADREAGVYDGDNPLMRDPLVPLAP